MGRGICSNQAEPGVKKPLEIFLLTRRELQIMKVVWERKSATIKDVHEALNPAKPTSRNTILTLIKILEQKGVLIHRRSGRAYFYEPLLSRPQATQNQIRDLTNRFFDGNAEKLVETLVQNEIKTPEQIGSTKCFVESRLVQVVAEGNGVLESPSISGPAIQ